MKKRIIFFSMAFLSVVYLLPVVFTFIKSLSYEESKFTLRQYLELLTTNHTVMKFFWNSFFYSVMITFFCLLFSFPIGFFFAKMKFRGGEAIFFVYVMVMLLPFQTTLLPNYIELRELSLLNTRLALILPMMFSPFAVFLLRQFMITIPEEQLEYATLETKSVIKILFHVVLPQTKEALMALAVMIFCESWNMVEQVLLFLPQNKEAWPLSVMLTEVPEDVTFSGAVVYMYPVLLLFLCFRKTLSKSMEKFRW